MHDLFCFEVWAGTKPSAHLVSFVTPENTHNLFAHMLLLLFAGSTPVRVSPSKTPVRPDPRHDDTPVPRRSDA